MNFDPNPLFFEMFNIYEENKHKDDKVVICNEGSTRCFHESTKIITSKGNISISKIKQGDKVYTYNEITKKNEFKEVESPLRFRNTKKCLKVILKNGKQIIATEDHEFYYKGAWVPLKDIVSLWHENRNNNK